MREMLKKLLERLRGRKPDPAPRSSGVRRLIGVRSMTCPWGNVAAWHEDLGLVDGYYVSRFTFDGEDMLSKVPSDVTTAAERFAHDVQMAAAMGIDLTSLLAVEQHDGTLLPFVGAVGPACAQRG